MPALRVRHKGLASVLYDGAFKMLIDTTQAGSASDTFILPASSGGYYRSVVSWGDGSSEALSNTPGNVTHVYPAAGQYVVSIRGDFPRIYFNNGGDKAKVLRVLQWGAGQWVEFTGAFFGCSNLDDVSEDAERANTKAATSWLNAFRGCTSLTKMPRLDTSNATTLSGLCLGNTALKIFPQLLTSKVTVFTSLCNGCSALTSFPFIDTAAATNIGTAWDACAALTSFPALDFRSVTAADGALRNCTGLAGFNMHALDLRSLTGTGGANMLVGTAISKASYNSILDQLANGRGDIPANPNSSVRFNAGSFYDSSTGYDGKAARLYLTGTKGWTITDLGEG